MNITAFEQKQQTMSSKEIAGLTLKEHKNVLRVIRDLIAQNLVAQIKPLKYEYRGQSFDYFELNKRDTLVAVARLSPEFTAAVIDRWQELENANQPKLPQTFAEALQLAADQAKQLELAAPKIAFVDNLVSRGVLMNATQVAQKHKISAKRLNEILDGFGVYSKSVTRARVFNSWFVSLGYGEMKQSLSGYSQALFTCKGEVWINDRLCRDGVC